MSLTPEMNHGRDGFEPAAGDGGGATAATGVGHEPTGGEGSNFIRRFRGEKLAVASVIILLVLIAFSFLGPLLLPHTPEGQVLSRSLEGPSATYWLGTDNLGRDMLVRLADGGRLSFAAALWSVGTALLIGVPLGLSSGYSGGWIDSGLMRFNDTLMSFPPLILAIAIVGFLGPSLRNAMVAIGVVFAPRFARVIRAATMSAREETYIEAARALGVPRLQMVTRHIVPNILSPVIVQITITLGLAILAEASLSFIGLGVQPPRASWGALLGSQMRFMEQAPLNVIGPGVLIMLAVLCSQLLGDGLRDSLGREIRGGR